MFKPSDEMVRNIIFMAKTLCDDYKFQFVFHDTNWGFTFLSFWIQRDRQLMNMPALDLVEYSSEPHDGFKFSIEALYLATTNGTI